MTFARVGWLVLLLSGIGLVAWSIPLFEQLGARREELLRLVAADKQDAALIAQLDGWREAADQARAQASRDRSELFSMYENCRSLDDFFVVHPDHLVSMYRQTSSGFTLRTYVPEGEYRLVATVAAQGREAKENAVLKLAPVRREFMLRGGSVYEMSVQVRQNDEQQSSLHIAMTDHAPVTVQLGPLDQRGSSHRGGAVSLLRAPYYLEGNGLSCKHRLADTSFYLVRRTDKQETRLRVRVELEGTGPPRLPANDPALLYRLTAPTANLQSSVQLDLLEYHNGWYDAKPLEAPAEDSQTQP